MQKNCASFFLTYFNVWSFRNCFRSLTSRLQFSQRWTFFFLTGCRFSFHVLIGHKQPFFLCSNTFWTLYSKFHTYLYVSLIFSIFLLAYQILQSYNCYSICTCFPCRAKSHITLHVLLFSFALSTLYAGCNWLFKI